MYAAYRAGESWPPVGEMNRTVQVMALAVPRQRHPDHTQEQRRRRLASLLLGSELTTRV